jgi:hypothetical protein
LRPGDQISPDSQKDKDDCEDKDDARHVHKKKSLSSFRLPAKAVTGPVEGPNRFLLQ